MGLIFMIPGVDETLRVNGMAELRTDPDLPQRFQVSRRPPAIVLRITVRQAYLHCAKALMRSRLWDPDARIDRTELPTMGEMMRDQRDRGRSSRRPRWSSATAVSCIRSSVRQS